LKEQPTTNPLQRQYFSVISVLLLRRGATSSCLSWRRRRCGVSACGIKEKMIERMKYVAQHKQLTWLFHTHYLNVGRRTVE
jgi:hypothetical protein